MMTLSEIVMRVTPPSIDAAPMSEYEPGFSDVLPPPNLSRMNSPRKRPPAAPRKMSGTNNPAGTPMPKVKTASM